MLQKVEILILKFTASFGKKYKNIYTRYWVWVSFYYWLYPAKNRASLTNSRVYVRNAKIHLSALKDKSDLK